MPNSTFYEKIKSIPDKVRKERSNFIERFKRAHRHTVLNPKIIDLMAYASFFNIIIGKAFPAAHDLYDEISKPNFDWSEDSLNQFIMSKVNEITDSYKIYEDVFGQYPKEIRMKILIDEIMAGLARTRVFDIDDKLVMKERSEAQAQKYIGYEKAEPEQKNEMANSAYASYVKAIMIGAVATATRVHEKADKLPSDDLSNAAKSLEKKHNPEWPELKSRYILSHGKKPMREKYGGANNVYRGYLYALERVKKYESRLGMPQAVRAKLADVYDLPHICSTQELLTSAKNNIKLSIENLSKTQAMALCLKNTLNSYFLLEHSDKQTDAEFLMQAIVLNEIHDVIEQALADSEREHGEINIAEYTKAMHLLNLNLMSQLQLTNNCPKDQYFQTMTGDAQGETLMADGGGKALLASFGVLGLTSVGMGCLPGFNLPNVDPKGEPRCGYFEWCDGDNPSYYHRVAVIGRDSETQYDDEKLKIALGELLNIESEFDSDSEQEQYNGELFNIDYWCRQNPKPKLLVVDVTIPTQTHTDIILQKLIELRSRLSEHERKDFDLLVIRSEQKQHSLGLGKFAAGASFLITDDEERRRKFNEAAKKPRSPDQILATFYREKLDDSVNILVKEQCEIAKQYANSRTDAIANGPFVLVKRPVDPRNIMNTDFDELKLPKGYSFGFIEQNYTSWNIGQSRIDPGARPPRKAKK